MRKFNNNLKNIKEKWIFSLQKYKISAIRKMNKNIILKYAENIIFYLAIFIGKLYADYVGAFICVFIVF